MILMGLWGYAVNFLTLIQWLICLFTGKRNQGIWNFTNSYLGYSTRVMTYAGLMHDVFPAFGTDAGAVPVTYELPFAPNATANRLTVVLRIIWAIPALLILMLVGIAGQVLTIVAWFAILITGSMPRGMYDFLVKVHRYAVQVNAYTLLLTDTYPAYQ